MKICKNKILAMLTICLLIVCNVFFLSCKKSCKGKENENQVINYYVTFDYNNGNSSNMVMVEKDKVVSKPNDPVKDGYTFIYWSLNDSEYDFNTPITNHITLIATYKSNEIKTARVRWLEDESITFVYDGDVPRNVEVGSTVKFKINESPYYEGNLEVFVNNTKINKSSNGYYEFTILDETTLDVSVSGLTKLNSKIKGNGTSENPYVIENTAQFKAFVDGVNSLYDTRYNGAYFVLNNDLDFKDYEIEMIGDKLNDNHFSGHFDGQNHTISNFKLNDKEGLLGLFGYVVTAEISNLHLESDLCVTPSNENYNLIGSLIAYNIGSDIYNCSFKGSINVKNELANDSNVYVGGLIGYLQSYSTTNSASLNYSFAETNIISTGNTEISSAGGLVGYLFGTNEGVPAYIYNSYFNGKIEGGVVTAGGIVGIQDKYTAVTECYSKGTIDATTKTRNTSSGAIVGLSKNENAVNHCFSTAKLISSNPNKTLYINGSIIGSNCLDGNGGMDDFKTLELKNYYSQDGSVEDNNKNYNLNSLDDLVKLLGWKKENWNSDLTPNSKGMENTEISITFDFGRYLTYEGNDGNDLTQSTDVVTSNGCIPIYWIYGGAGKNNFVADDGTISYGYYLDKECTIRIPASFVVTQDMTVYVGFSNYQEVVGEYYINLSNMEIKLVFEDNGKLVMQYDGILENYIYFYDGNKITIKDAYFAQIEYPFLTNSLNDEVDYLAIIDGENLLIYNDAYFPIEDGLEITAYKINSAMGKWYSSNNDVYRFYSNGTGTINNESTFLYEFENNNVKITIGKQVITAYISEDGTKMVASDETILSITKFDIFKGLWESDFVLQQTIDFDGKGNVVYNGKSYKYTIDNEVAVFDKYQAYYNEDNLLVVKGENKETVFGREGSFIGSWTDTIIDYWIAFYGIGRDGYGHGYDSNGFAFTYVLDSEESGLDNFITMYYGTVMYGYGELAVGKDGTKMLYLAVYTPSRGMIVDDYNACYMDSFYGTWHGEDGMSLTFNGLGGYDIYEYIYSLQQYWDVRGFVTVEKDGNKEDVRYSFDLETNTGSFEYNNATYIISIENDKLVINDVIYKYPDGLELYSYQVDDKVFVFNGKSTVDLGEVILKEKNVENIYNYVINENIIEIYDNNTLIYTIDTENNFTLKDEQSSDTYNLGLYHKLIGKTFAISTLSTIVFDAKFDINGIATASLISNGETYELNLLYIDDSYIAIYQGESFLYYAYSLDENCAAICDYSFSVISVMATPDELCGKWVSKDGEEIVFDGLSYANEYIYASCIITEIDEIGSYLETYSYEKLENYYVIQVIENGVEVDKYYVYTEYVENSVEYTQNGKSIYVVVA